MGCFLLFWFSCYCIYLFLRSHIYRYFLTVSYSAVQKSQTGIVVIKVVLRNISFWRPLLKMFFGHWLLFHGWPFSEECCLLVFFFYLCVKHRSSIKKCTLLKAWTSVGQFSKNPFAKPIKQVDSHQSQKLVISLHGLQVEDKRRIGRPLKN